jgi:hypothetical protein
MPTCIEPAQRSAFQLRAVVVMPTPMAAEWSAAVHKESPNRLIGLPGAEAAQDGADAVDDGRGIR